MAGFAVGATANLHPNEYDEYMPFGQFGNYMPGGNSRGTITPSYGGQRQVQQVGPPKVTYKVNGETLVESQHTDEELAQSQVIYENEYTGPPVPDTEYEPPEESDYGSISKHHKPEPQKKSIRSVLLHELGEFQPAVLIAATVGSLVIFALAEYVSFSKIRYGHWWMTALILFLMFCGIVYEGFSQGIDTSKPKGKLAAFTVGSNLLALFVGAMLGEATYQQNFKTYYDFKQLAHYPSADPSVYFGQRYNDAGQVDFFWGSHLDTSRSYGFKMGSTYCVSPIVGPETRNWTCVLNGIPDCPTPQIDNYDYWAVGVDCCSVHKADFHCGQYLNPNAHKGLRLMRDDLRDYFRLAVLGAKAEHNIESKTPLFFYLMESPEVEVETWNRDGWMEFLHSVLGYGSLTIGVTGIASFCVVTSAMKG